MAREGNQGKIKWETRPNIIYRTVSKKIFREVKEFRELKWQEKENFYRRVWR